MHNRMVNKTKYNNSEKPIKQINFTEKQLEGNLPEKQSTIVKRGLRFSTKTFAPKLYNSNS